MPSPDGSNTTDGVLTINGGSSSIKFALFVRNEDHSPHRMFSGGIERIGLPETRFSSVDHTHQTKERLPITAPDFDTAGRYILDWLGSKTDLASIRAVGHRVVHGGPKYSAPQVVNSEVLRELRRISPYDPEHVPAEIALIELCQRLFPQARQVACFDTAFHSTLPRVAQILPIPRKYEAQGLRRYGFHGLSYAYLMEELARIETAGVGNRESGIGKCILDSRLPTPDSLPFPSRLPTPRRIILAHFGNGASLAAVKDGRSIDTSMGFTPTAGIPMGTRSGNIDPGIVAYLTRTVGMTADAFHAMVNHESGLIGVSETSSDMRDLLARETTDVRAAEAVALFCYEARKWIGAFAAALGGLDTLVFAGGIGEHGSEIRARICSELKFLGIELDAEKNAVHAPVISKENAAVTVRVIPTDEESVIAKACIALA